MKTFTKEELRSFEKFLQSPFLKPARDTTELYNYIIKCYPDYDDLKLEKEKIYKKLFAGESFNEKKILNLIYDLTKAAEDFLAYSTIMKDEVDFLLNLSKGYLNKNLSDESHRVNKMIEKKLKPGFSPDKDYISKFRRLTFLKSSYYIENIDYENLLVAKRKYFEALAVQFIIDYSETVSAKIPAMETYGKNLESDFINSVIESFDLDKLLKMLEKSDYENKHFIILHYYLLKMNDDKSYKFYFQLRDTFYELLNLLDREEKCFIFSHLVNYCSQNYGSTKEDFRSEIFEVYKKMLENDCYSLSENEYMQELTYRNILLSAIALKEFDWVGNFSEKYSTALQPEYRDDLKNLSYAYIHFSKKEFEKALERVSKINHEFFLFKSDLKNLMLKIYYEMEYYEQAFSMIDSYKHFLSYTNEITKSYKVLFSDFLGYYMMLLKIKCGESKELPSFIKKQIQKNSEVVNRIWLLEKAEELSKVF
ncbi:MAG: hypothetical protein ABI462_06705 [Ignavibacteria bacterium]